MKKGADAFRSIGEVAKLIGVAPHVLRYWETQFPQLRPMKRPDGRRYYRPDDVRLAAGLCEVLRDDGLTIRGAKKLLARDRGETIRARGAARIDGLIGKPQPDSAALPPDAADTAPDADTAAPVPAPARGHANGPAPLPASAADPPPDFDDEEQDDMADHSPRSRHRRRRHGQSDDGSLPLFPDLDRTSPDAAWLTRLTYLSARLRQTPGGHPALGRARPHMTALCDAIAGLY
ncbi:MerR family transcriptional regulator [Paracoccus stylophorae]|uniref:MerR family transcriptional regulator n=1 Tax=Paracoccus stylophorae TaxID=659350 RepID=A0ABY7SSV6_9RHOB|nr:MerR family transcriptional regulator [Paracoccus stylophorae]WCR10111.1 MerR family transcriptional regulator [Paracoccus stylophorae]